MNRWYSLKGGLYSVRTKVYFPGADPPSVPDGMRLLNSYHQILEWLHENLIKAMQNHVEYYLLPFFKKQVALCSTHIFFVSFSLSSLFVEVGNHHHCRQFIEAKKDCFFNNGSFAHTTKR